MKKILILMVSILCMGMSTQSNAQCNAVIGNMNIIEVFMQGDDQRIVDRGIMPVAQKVAVSSRYIIESGRRMHDNPAFAGRDTINYVGSVYTDVSTQPFNSISLFRDAILADPKVISYFDNNQVQLMLVWTPREILFGDSGSANISSYTGMNAVIFLAEDLRDDYYSFNFDERLQATFWHEFGHNLRLKGNSMHTNGNTLENNQILQVTEFTWNTDNLDIIVSAWDEKMAERGHYVDYDGDCYEGDQDCDENNASINAGATEIPNNAVDENCDGILGMTTVDTDGDGFDASVDCDDNDPNINPGMDEVCGNGIDDNCNGQIDEGRYDEEYYFDVDGDGFGDEGFGPITFFCSDPDPQNFGYITVGGDCVDTIPYINPDATEICDGIDNNCDGDIDEGLLTTYYADVDGDGFGNLQNPTEDCGSTPPMGFVDNRQDCDDNNSNVYINAPEICDGVDNDCDGKIDGNDDNLVGGTTYYLDSDNDGFGDPDNSVVDCTQPSGYVLDNTDCDDDDPIINPAAIEILDNMIDENCDGIAEMTQVVDNDNDGSNSDEDCDDNDNTIYPGAPELCDNKDNNCDGEIDEGLSFVTYYTDADGDGFGDAATEFSSCEVPSNAVTDNTDCDDTDPTIYPGAPEVLGDNIDQNCDGRDQTTGVHNIDGIQINVFPNPVSHTLYIQSESSLRLDYSIYSVSGNLLYRLSDTQEIDVSALPLGIFLLEIKNPITGSRVVERKIKI